MPGIYHGRTAEIEHQFETAFRTAPTTPNSQLMKFVKATFGRVAELVDDETINNAALMETRDEEDSDAPVSIEGRLCLNDFGTWLKMLLGAPVTTGSGPYTHVFTLNLTDRPSALLQLALTAPSGPTTRYHRHLGVMADKLSWGIVDAPTSFKLDCLGAIELRPYPTAYFDSTPTARRAKNFACKKNGRIYDGTNPIGDIAKGTIAFDNDLEGLKLADGQEGLGTILLGQPSVSGSMDVLFRDDTNKKLVDDALARTSKHVVLVSKNTAGDATLTVDIPAADLDVPRIVVETSKGILVRNMGWRAANNATAVTVTLVNGVSAY